MSQKWDRKGADTKSRGTVWGWRFSRKRKYDPEPLDAVARNKLTRTGAKEVGTPATRRARGCQEGAAPPFERSEGVSPATRKGVRA